MLVVFVYVEKVSRYTTQLRLVVFDFGNGYPHDGRADKNPYPHDRRADKDSYPHDSNNQCVILRLQLSFVMINYEIDQL